MAFDFPASPSTGTLFQPAGGPTYRYSGSVWNVVAAPFQGAMASDTTPANPVPGQLWWESDTGALFYYFDDGNSQQWVQITGATAGSIVQTIITTSGTYTPPAGLKFLEVSVVGGGGGSISVASTSASQSNVSGGGGGGGAAFKLYAASDLAATEAYTVGAGGVGGTPTAGGTTTFKGLSGGGGSPSGAATGNTATLGALSVGGAGGVATGGTLNIDGTGASMGIANPHNRPGLGMRGSGGSSFFALSLTSEYYGSGATPGTAGRFPGGGAVGAANAGAVGSTTAGAAGGDGCIILKEYF